MAEQITNFGRTSLDGAVSDSDTTIVVTDGGVFPSVGNFRLNCEDELMLCTSRTGNSLTVTRGVEGTTAVSHGTTSAVTQVVTAGAIQEMFDERTTLNKLYAYNNFK